MRYKVSTTVTVFEKKVPQLQRYVIRTCDLLYLECICTLMHEDGDDITIKITQNEKLTVDAYTPTHNSQTIIERV